MPNTCPRSPYSHCPGQALKAKTLWLYQTPSLPSPKQLLPGSSSSHDSKGWWMVDNTPDVPPGTRGVRTALLLGRGAVHKSTLGMPGEGHPSLSCFVLFFILTSQAWETETLISKLSRMLLGRLQEPEAQKWTEKVPRRLQRIIRA